MSRQNASSKSSHYALCLKEFKIAAISTMSYILICCFLCYVLGYGKDAAEMPIIYGVPLWVLYGVIIPWVVMVIFTAIYGFFVMKGDDE